MNTVFPVSLYPYTSRNRVMNPIKQAVIPPVQIYIGISAVLLAPILFWPLIHNFTDNGLNPAGNIHQIWLIMACTLLICAATADSVIGYRPDNSWPAISAAWILFTTLGVSFSLRLSDGDWLLALMFALHSLRAMVALWRNGQHWHLWPAWGRDTLASAALFFWSMF